MWTREAVAEQLRMFAGVDGLSPLYAALCPRIAGDEDLLALAVQTRADQPPPNMLFGAVQYLLLKQDRPAPLAQFYASLTDAPEPPDRAFDAFRTYCLDHREAVAGILRTRVTNTNEVGRCSVLAPGLRHVAHALGDAPLHMIELGCSAGLNLYWDLYGYSYDGTLIWGGADNPVRLECALRGGHRPDLSGGLPRVASRRAIEANPVDLTDTDNLLWLRALVWPEERARAARLGHAFERAAARARQVPPQIVEGLAQDHLEAVIAAVPDGEPVCVYHSLVMYQIPQKDRARIDEILRAAGRTRPVWRVALEIADAPACTLEVTDHGSRRGKAADGAPLGLANCHPHGAWLEWL